MLLNYKEVTRRVKRFSSLFKFNCSGDRRLGGVPREEIPEENVTSGKGLIVRDFAHLETWRACEMVMLLTETEG